MNRFFLSYGLQVRDGQAYDPGNEYANTPDNGFKVFDNVIVESDGRVSQFTHCGGDGPVAQIIECRDTIRPLEEQQ